MNGRTLAFWAFESLMTGLLVMVLLCAWDMRKVDWSFLGGPQIEHYYAGPEPLNLTILKPIQTEKPMILKPAIAHQLRESERTIIIDALTELAALRDDPRKAWRVSQLEKVLTVATPHDDQEED